MMSQAGEAKARRGWLRGSFTLRLLDAVIKRTDCSSVPTDENSGEEIVLDFVAPTQEEELSEKVKQLWDKGMLMVEIAQELGLFKSQVTAALKFWFDRAGKRHLTDAADVQLYKRRTCGHPDSRKSLQRCARLYEQNMQLGQIAVQLNVDPRDIG